MKDVVLSRYTEDFARAALDYCIMLERSIPSDKRVFVGNMTRILPLLYLKATVIPAVEEDYETEAEGKVSEGMYNLIESRVADLLGDDNVYLETFHPDIRMSDTPVAVKISEDLADIWQDLGNFISVFKNGDKATMSDSLRLCLENFRRFWGQRLVNALRALHNIMVSESEEGIGND
jgi:hypothetical protein